MADSCIRRMCLFVHVYVRACVCLCVCGVCAIVRLCDCAFVRAFVRACMRVCVWGEVGGCVCAVAYPEGDTGPCPFLSLNAPPPNFW